MTQTSIPNPHEKHQPDLDNSGLIWRVDHTALRLELLKLGYRPIPLAANSKQPPHGFSWKRYASEPVTVEDVQRWASEYPDATNTAIVITPEFVVLDTDSEAAEQYLAAQLDGEPKGPTVGTARGRHRYFRRPDWLISSMTGKAAPLPGLDVKASGYVVAPGSIHPDGHEYREIVTLAAGWPALPDWLADILRSKQGTRAGGLVTTPHRTPQNARNSDGATVDTSDLVAAIEALLGVHDGAFNADGWAAVRCPFHDDQHASATWSRDAGGQLVCHAGCRPGTSHVSAGRTAFGAIDTARQLGVPLKAGASLRYAASASPKPTNNAAAAEELDQAGLDGAADFLAAFFPPPPLLFTRGEKHRKKLNQGRPQDLYTLQDVADVSAFFSQAGWGVPHFRPLTADELSDAKLYRALAYAPLVAGRQRRDVMAQRIGVTAKTARTYDALAGVRVTEMVKRARLTADSEAALAYWRKDESWNTWIESTDGKKHAPTRNGLRRALAASIQHDGRAIAWLCRQGMNWYDPPDRDTGAVGLPVELRRLYIRQGMIALARVVDALLLAGARPGDTFTKRQLVQTCKLYGVSGWTVRAALSQLKRWGNA